MCTRDLTHTKQCDTGEAANCDARIQTSCGTYWISAIHEAQLLLVTAVPWLPPRTAPLAHPMCTRALPHTPQIGRAGRRRLRYTCYKVRCKYLQLLCLCKTQSSAVTGHSDMISVTSTINCMPVSVHSANQPAVQHPANRPRGRTDL